MALSFDATDAILQATFGFFAVLSFFATLFAIHTRGALGLTWYNSLRRWLGLEPSASSAGPTPRQLEENASFASSTASERYELDSTTVRAPPTAVEAHTSPGTSNNLSTATSGQQIGLAHHQST